MATDDNKLGRVLNFGADGELVTLSVVDEHFLPINLEFEFALLGWAMREPDALALMMPHLKAEDFFSEVNRRLFERMVAKFETSAPVSVLTMWAAMKNDAGLIENGGLDALADMARFHAPERPKSLDQFEAQIRDAARTVADLAIRRDVESAVVDTIYRLRRGDLVETSLAPVVDAADADLERREQRNGASDVQEAARVLIEDMDRPDERLDAAPTGSALLDEIVGGNFEGELVIVGGRPGMGKSIIGQTFARAAAQAGYGVDYFDLENRRAILTARLLTDLDYDQALRDGRAPIHYRDVRLKRLSSDQRKWLALASEQLRDLDFQIHDRDQLTISQISSIARARAARSSKRRFVVIDHMHLVEPSQRTAGRRVDEIGEVSRGGKRLAKLLGAPVIELAQLNRGLEGRDDKRPQMADFRDSGSIEQDADTMFGAHRLHYYLERARPKSDATSEAKHKWEMALGASTNVIDMGLLKNRNGMTREVQLFIDVASAALRDQKPETGSSLFDPHWQRAIQFDALEGLGLDDPK